MTNILYILLLLLALLTAGFLEGNDVKIAKEHSKRTYCEVYGCYEDNNN
jgi:hypothetical protein